MVLNKGLNFYYILDELLMELNKVERKIELLQSKGVKIPESLEERREMLKKEIENIRIGIENIEGEQEFKEYMNIMKELVGGRRLEDIIHRLNKLREKVRNLRINREVIRNA
ncbi:hypothetical protein CM19_06835 [Candidatus Acidianus copahuensis]|uniref:Uncharacterized protein n=1 Tax=Candidatus Acidianus copahuensis TaxID=1160895 RepID=A0A031LQS8_9CREN|nr:hypothetical protein [Candidatus Acidianus copahuensis]EZQ07120.1 hypothetical protein CM19_06835 [Candidatus Acidianus copahuensis]